MIGLDLGVAGAPRSDSRTLRNACPALASKGPELVRAGSMRQTVLVVDDDPAIARLVSLSLSDRFEVVIAGNGAEGLGRLTNSRPDAVVLDLEMPVMNGWTFLPLLRWCLPAVPVVIVSAFDAVEAARLLRADGAFEKPFDPLTLAEYIERLLDGVDGLRLSEP